MEKDSMLKGVCVCTCIERFAVDLRVPVGASCDTAKHNILMNGPEAKEKDPASTKAKAVREEIGSEA